MKITWLGQAGLLFEMDGYKIMVDPYLSDSVKKVNPANYRRMPVDESIFDIRPDVLILTHSHLDHTDPETLEVILKKYNGICVLASGNAWQQVRAYGGDHNYVSFNRGTTWTVRVPQFSKDTQVNSQEQSKEIVFEAVYAEHSDDHAIGVVICYEGKNYYIAGDTLYNKRVIEDLPKVIDVAFLPINGVGNNMNMIDAAKFAKKIGAKKTVPIHFGMFDELDPRDFSCDTKVIPTIYEEV